MTPPDPLRRRLQRALGATLGVALDELFMLGSLRPPRARRRAAPPDAPSGAPPSDAPQDLVAALSAAADLYDAAAAEGRLFSAPPAADLEATRRGPTLPDGGQTLDVRWPSVHAPLHDAYAAALERCPPTRWACARWLRHPEPAPALLCLHGWGAGAYPIAERAYPSRWLYALGLDVLHVTLPFQGARANPRGVPTPAFPSASPTQANEGFAQATSDLRALTSTLLARGAPAVGASGMSLGGFTCGLLATVEPRLAFAAPLIPFASLPELLWHHGRGSAPQARARAAGVDLARFAAAFAATAPLTRQPVIDPRRVLVGVAAHDRVTPPEQGRALAAHFPGSRLLIMPGAHLLQLGRRRFFAALRDLLVRLDVVSP